ncbi:MAG: TIGR00282 family metallophosphoesterase [Oscillospiraceae bacterium]|nr:TIGR00282 family metallophosphoesterase [Oscillospiraceae bacterium]
MKINILAIGDVCGQTGLDFLISKLHGIKKWGNIEFTVVNGENTAGLGITPAHADALFDAGADVITLGNHTWSIQKINKYLDDNKHILRPSNFAPQVPGRGWGIFETSFGNVCVINLVGRVNMHEGSDNPFYEADRILKQCDTNIVLVDFHAEATSEKHALCYYLDGRVSALWGTHTHVQTSDNRVFQGGTGYITDLGMTGACDSIIGMKPDQPVSRFLGNPPQRFEPAEGPARVEGAIFEIDTQSGKCLSVNTIRVM